MNYQELKAKLAEMGLPTTGNTATLQARYDDAVAAASSSPATDAAPAAPAAPEKVLCNGVELTPCDANSESLRTFVRERRLREFPQLLAPVPDGDYVTTGRFSLYPWHTLDREGNEIPATLLVVEIENNESHARYFIGEWEFVSRTYGFTPAGGELQEPEWVLSTFATGSLRSEAVLAMPAGTTCVKHSGLGRLTDKPGTRNYLCHWVARS